MHHEEPVILYTRGVYTHTDDDGTHHYRNERKVYCGDQDQGEKQYCDECMAYFKAEYPQGWRYYPGDCCPHGMYVGGIGIDHMCGACEMGEDDE